MAIDLSKVEQIVSAIVAAAPAIEQGVMSSAPYVEAIIELIKAGGSPTDEQWAALNARLDAGSAALDKAAQSD